MLKTILVACVALFMASTASAQMFDDLSDTDRAALQAEIRTYLMQNPEILEEMVALLQAEREAVERQRDRQLLAGNREALEDDGVSAVLGNPDGDITIVEFLDYQCGFCKRAHPEVAQLLEADGNIRLVQKELPILGPVSISASKAALAILLNEGPQTYMAYSDLLMSFEGQLTSAAITGLARKAGADIATMQITAEGPQVAAIISSNMALAQALQISGTPSFVFGDQLVRGYLPVEDMMDLVAEMRGES